MERGGAAGKGKICQAVERCNSTTHPNELLLDEYLRSQGLYRKRIAKDGSCLFRAVSEQVFYTQSKHLEVRRACVSYLRRNRDKFEAFIEGSFDEYLKHLEKPQEWVGQVEISALSLLYKRDFVIYQEPNRPPARVTENGFPDTIFLCFSNGNHYDSVYPKTFVDAAAICQSILYEMLYQNVFKVDVRAIMPAVLDANSEINEEHFNGSENSDSDVEIEVFGCTCIHCFCFRYNASLQNLRPLSQISRGSSWNRVQGKRAKKPMNINSEADFKGVKNSSSFVNKPSRLQSSLPPRLQQTMGARQQHSTQQSPGQQPKKSSAEYVGRHEDFPQLSKKYDRDLELNHTNAECQHLASSMKVEPEANEAQSPNKMHQRVEQPFPALHNPLEIPPCPTVQRMDPVLQSDLSLSRLPSSAPSLTSPVLSVHSSESVTCRSAECLTQTVVSTFSSSSVMSSQTMSQAQVTSAFITPLSAPMHGANLPPMPASQITSCFDDLLYPGFAVSEKGEYLTSAPVFSYNKNGADLPSGK
ncbi:OTU domain-containing protein 4 [Rhincodon typus]|uniref:OTU domain-containing protein 4 n=1 Tax=Rhincodon typus TaxID=259920 RepID=UPI00202F203F|nr:OTU domain-containing protein 4 [Rhincodon typus]